MATPLSPHQSKKTNKEDVQPVADKIAELNESQTELLGRIRGLKECLHSWRVKLDTQVKTYQDELSDLKKALSSEMEQLTLDFQELRTTLQKQQDDVAASLLNLDITYAQLQ
jgi:predicted  nucleic acid-binding Zn-ribbon protein